MAQPVHDALDRGRVHRRRPAQRILRGRAQFAQLGQRGELRRRQAGDHPGEDRQMPLRRAAQQESHLFVQPVAVGLRIIHAAMIPFAPASRKGEFRR